MKKRVKQLVSFYAVLAILITTFGFCFNVFAINFSGRKGDEAYLKIGDFVSSSDTIKNVYYGYAYYYDASGNNLGYDYINYDSTYTFRNVLSGYNSWEVVNLNYYDSTIDGITLKASNKPEIIDPVDQNIKYGEEAKFSTNAVASDGSTFAYNWFKVNSNTITNFDYDDNNFVESTINDEKVFALSDSKNSYYAETIYKQVKSGYFYIDYTNLDGYLDIFTYGDTYSSNYERVNGSGTMKLYSDGGNLGFGIDYYCNSSDRTGYISNIKYIENDPIDTGVKTKDFILTPDLNSKFYENGNVFYAVMSNGKNTFQTKTAKLNISAVNNTFTDSNDNGSIVLDKDVDRNLQLRIIDITSKLEYGEVKKLNDSLDSGRTSINIFNVGMYDEDKLVDIGEGDYLLKVKIPDKVKNYTSLCVSELDAQYNIVDTQKPKIDGDEFSFTVNKLNNFTITGVPITNPVTSSTIIVALIILIIVTGSTIGIAAYNNKLKKN